MGMIRNIACVSALIVIAFFMLMFAAGIRPAVVMSGSMAPEIGTGSLVLIDTGDRNIRKGDIIAFETGGALVTHRIVRKTGGGWITRGDANEEEDPWTVREKNIRGKTVLCIPKAGYAAKMMQTKAGIITSALICVLLLLSVFIRKGVEIDDGEKDIGCAGSPDP